MGNLSIVKFCGYELTKDAYGVPVYKMPDHAYEERDEDGCFYTVDTFNHYWDMEFATSWDWLIPVITKIFSLPFAETEGLEEYIDIYMNADKMGFHTPIGVCFDKVVEFLEWYETNKTERNE